MRRQSQFFANHSTAQSEPQVFVNAGLKIEEGGWVQLAPFGDFINVDMRGNRVVQRFEKADAEAIVNEFNSLLNLPQRLLGLPWYIGHPDHPRFATRDKDGKAYGRVKQLQVRDDGLYANVKFNDAGKQLLDGEAFHGHSVNWLAVPTERENGIQIFRPVSLKSVGFTNEPAIPVRPASIANEATLNAATFDEPLTGYAVGPGGADKDRSTEGATDDMMIPPRLKLLAGFKADEDVTIEQVIAAIETARTRQAAREGSTNNMANEKPVELTIGDRKFSVVLANEADAELPTLITALGTKATKAEQDLANALTAQKAERKSRATLVVEPLVKAGKITAADKDAKIEELCNAQNFDAKAAEFASAKPVVKTTSKTGNLAGKHMVLNGDQAALSQKFDSLMSARAQQFPNEAYLERFSAVAGSEQGEALIAQMKRAGEE